MQSIALADRLRFTTRRGPFVLDTRHPNVPADRTNLVWRAAELLWRAIGRPGDPRDVHVRLEKAIPAAAGLGGGSADAAATLAGLNVLWEARRPRRELARLASELGADVPFFLQGGTALGTGRGDELYPVDDAARLGVVVIKPSFGVSTADAYRWLDEDRAAGAAEASSSRDVDLGWPSGPIRLVERPGRARGQAPSNDSGDGGGLPPGGRVGGRDDGKRVGGFRAVFRGPGQGGLAQAPAGGLAHLPDPDHQPAGGGPAGGRVIDFRVRDGHVRPD